MSAQRRPQTRVRLGHLGDAGSVAAAHPRAASSSTSSAAASTASTASTAARRRGADGAPAPTPLPPPPSPLLTPPSDFMTDQLNGTASWTISPYLASMSLVYQWAPDYLYNTSINGSITKWAKQHRLNIARYPAGQNSLWNWEKPSGCDP